LQLGVLLLGGNHFPCDFMSLSAHASLFLFRRCCELLDEFITQLSEAWLDQDVGILKVKDQVATMFMTSSGRKQVIDILYKELKQVYGKDEVTGKPKTYLESLLARDVAPLVAPDCKIGFLKVSSRKPRM